MTSDPSHPDMSYCSPAHLIWEYKYDLLQKMALTVLSDTADSFLLLPLVLMDW